MYTEPRSYYEKQPSRVIAARGGCRFSSLRSPGREYGKQEYYHLGLDSGLLGTEESVECIVNILRRWCDVRGTHPLYLLNDGEK